MLPRKEGSGRQIEEQVAHIGNSRGAADSYRQPPHLRYDQTQASAQHRQDGDGERGVAVRPPEPSPPGRRQRREIAHEGDARSRSSERMAALSVPRPSFPLRRTYPGRSRRSRNGLVALTATTASSRTSGLPRSVTTIAPSSTALRTQTPVRSCSSVREIVFMCLMVTH